MSTAFSSMLKIEFNTTGRHDDLIEEQASQGCRGGLCRGRDLEGTQLLLHSTFHWPARIAASSTSCSCRFRSASVAPRSRKGSANSGMHVRKSLQQKPRRLEPVPIGSQGGS
jgi:hypothetical protein